MWTNFEGGVNGVAWWIWDPFAGDEKYAFVDSTGKAAGLFVVLMLLSMSFLVSILLVSASDAIQAMYYVNTARYTASTAMIQLRYTSNLKLDHNTFKYAGGWGVIGYEGTDNNSIVWNLFYKNAGGGVAMGIVGDQ